MISCTLEQVGDRLVLALDPDDARRLDLHVGDRVSLDLSGGGVLQVTEEVWTDDPHARGRAFLKRYRRTFAQLG